MIKVFEFAREKGFDEGYDKGKNDGYDKGKNDGRIEGYDKGVLSNARQMLLEVLGETIDVVPEYIEKKVEQIKSQTTLKGLIRQAIRSKSIKDFDQKLTMAVA